MLAQIQNSNFWNIQILGNSLCSLLTAFGIFVLALICLKIIKSIAIKRLNELAKKTKNQLDDIAIGAINDIHWPFYIITSLFIAINFISVSSTISKTMYFALIISATYYSLKVLEKFVDFGAAEVIKKQKEEKGSSSTAIVQISGSIIKLGLWASALLLILSNLGVNVSSIVAGLGIGGIAIALAIKEILSDLFSSFSIFFDKPFKVGDFIAVGSDKGTVIKIGIKTTRLQSLVGEELVISNTALTKATLQNFGKLQKRRVAFDIFVDQETAPAKLKKIPGLIEKIVKVEKNMEFSRTHFSSIDASNFIFNIVYFANTSDYVKYMNAKERINLGIVEIFSKEKILFSHPTQTVYVKKGAGK